MSFLTLWLLVFIFARSIASKHRNVNLALETVLQFDKPEDINLINKVQDFLSQIQVLLNKKRQTNDNDTTRRNIKYKFTDFVEDVITVVKSFEDDDLKEVIRIVDEDLNTRKDNYDLFDDNARRLLSRKLTEIRNQPAISIRNGLDTILRELRVVKNKRSSYILDFVNTLYKRNSERKLSKFIKRLNLFKRSARKSKVVLKSIIEKLINDVLYEHYNNLENNERRYIKKFVKVYLNDEISTTKKMKMKQRAKVTEIQENINTDEKIDESKAAELKATESIPETFNDVPKTTTKKIFTHITLYPKTIKLKKLYKFKTGLPTVNVYNSPEVLTDEENAENSKDKREEESKETKEILTNHSVEINVNLMFKRSPDAEEREDIQMIETFRTKYTRNKVLPRELKTKSRKNKKYQKSSTTPLSVETFGSLHKIKKPKKYNDKKIPRPTAYNDKTTMKDEYFKTSYVDTKETREKFHVDHRRVNKPTNLNEYKVTESHTKEVETTTQSVTRASILSITLTKKAKTPATTQKITTETTSDVLNDIFDSKNVTELNEITKNIPQERVSSNQEFITKDNVTKFENDSIKHMNSTTESEVSAIAFDVDNYVKNSEILNFDDEEKKKQIEEKMKADLDNLLESSSTNAPTKGFTDIFKELEDAFQI